MKPIQTVKAQKSENGKTASSKSILSHQNTELQSNLLMWSPLLKDLS